MNRPRFVREVWSQAWPTVITMLSYTLMQFVDAIMVAQVSPLALAAQGNGGVWSFVPLAFLFGMLSLVNSFVAQSVGAGRSDAVARYIGAGLWMAFLSWLVIMVPWAIVLPFVFAALPHDPELVRLESSYGQILAFGSIISLASKSVSNAFFGLQRPRVVTVGAIVGNIVNGLINYVLIFGEQGLPAWGLPGVPGVPALGVSGAALGTIGGVTAELMFPMALLFGRTMHERWGTRRAWRFPRREVLDLLLVGGPASTQMGNEIVCWAIFMSALVGAFGSLHLTAGWATLRYMHLSFMPAVGFSVAATSLVGRSIGEGRPDLARRRARTAAWMAVAYMGACAIVMVVLRRPLIEVFVGGDSTSAEEAAAIVAIGAPLMVCAAIFQVFDAVGIVYSGGLRGAGDTFVPAVATLVLSWGLIVGGGWMLVRFAPQLESLGPWIAASAYIIVLGLWMAARFERGRWMSRRLVAVASSARPAGSSEVA